jgi:hypothetical protein
MPPERRRCVGGLDKCCEFDCKTHEWIYLRDIGLPGMCQSSPGTARGVLCFDGQTYIFGGTMGVHYSNAILRFNARSCTWSKVVTTGHRPTPRYKHASVIVGDYMYVIGGGSFYPKTVCIEVYRLNMRTFIWEMMGRTPRSPLARIAHSCVSDGADRIFMFGGRNKKRVFGGLDVYHCKSNV